MNWRQKLYSNIFVRNVLASFGGRSGYSLEPGGFVPYFQYRIGPYQNDLFLYFPKEPFALRYKNEIFNKLNEYTGYDIIRYLEFHFSPYDDKEDFLAFLHYELSERLKYSPKNARMVSAFEWVADKKAQLQIRQNSTLRSEIEKGVKEIVQEQSSASPEEIDKRIEGFSLLLQEKVNQILDEAESGIRELTGSFTTGNIKLNNRNHEDQLVQLFILLQQVRSPQGQARTEQLFKTFTATDIAAILHLHFEAFGGNKINTLQRTVGQQAARLKPNHPKIKRLTEALEDFFY